MKVLNPKGTLIPIGGGEDKEYEKHVLDRVIKETGKRHPKICLITLATGLPEEVARDYKSAFRKLGITNLSVIYYHNRPEADSKDNMEKIRNCDVIMFSGGDQLKLSSLLGGTALLELIKERYISESKFVVAGTSAGAAAMSDTMIIAGSSLDALVKGELELTNGLDFIDGVFIDTHFTERGRFGRLFQTVTCNPGVIGIGLGEDTAVVIKKGELEVVGSGLVVIADGTSIEYTDLAEIHDGDVITVEGIKVSVLGPGKHYNIKHKKISESLKK